MLSGKTLEARTVRPLSARPTARWNTTRDCWETDQVDLLSGRSVVYSETFMTSGSMRNGVVYAHPMSGHLMDGSGSLSSQPDAKLLTAPTTTQRGTDANLDTREGARANLHNEILELLPTPKAGDADFGTPRTSGRPPEKSTHLMTRMEFTKPAETWGPYAAAIERWEQILGQPAPEPTELGPKGGRRLSAHFVAWMMGVPDGWVTGPGLGLSRTQQLKMLGNGVVTQQAVAALESMLPLSPTQLVSLARYGVTGADLKGEHDEGSNLGRHRRRDPR